MKTVKILIVTTILFALLGSMSFSALADSKEIITDDEDDVLMFTEDALMGDGDDLELETTSEKPNLDIVQVTYMRVDGSKEVTIELEVNSRGIIQDQNDFEDFNTTNLTGSLVTYGVSLQTSENLYEIEYIDGVATCNLDEATASTDGSVLTITFELESVSETFDSLRATTVEFEIQSITSIKYYMDIAPNDALFMAFPSATPSTAETDESIDFTVEINDDLGITISPYTYLWDFDDGTTSTQQNPSHSYQYAGEYQVTVTVEDASGQTTEATIDITVEKAGGSSSNGSNNNGGDASESTPGFELLTLVAAIGVGAVLLYYKRRR